MTLRPDTIRRIEERVTELIEDFDACCDVFDRANLFTGPSAYFYSKTLALLWQHKSAGDAILDTAFLESLYATLTPWGMHRMGRGDTKLVEFPIFVDSFRRLEQPFRKLSALALADLRMEEVKSVTEQAWAVISGLNIGCGLTKIVAGSKALHHVLPELVPPIDREYTIRFFFHHTNLSQGDAVAFREIYPRFHRIAVECRAKIRKRIGRGMNTCPTKVIDNAIVGFVRAKLKNAPDDAESDDK
jgi:hypothetical protein